MSQILKLTVTENGVTRNATSSEVIAWHLLKLHEACFDPSHRCDTCQLNHKFGPPGLTTCLQNYTCAKDHIESKEILIEVEDE